MEEIHPNIHGARMSSRSNGTHQLVLVTLNELWADVLLHNLGSEVALRYSYDGADITFYLELQLPHMDKLFKIPVNASTATLKWLNWIDEKAVTAVWVAHRDGKGGIMPVGKPVQIS